MKMVSVLIPCYNEEENVKLIARAVEKIFKLELPKYDYEIVFIDNDSSDLTRSYLREICEQNKKIKAIFNAKNFGQFNSPYYGLMQTQGDCTILLCCDFQDPIELLPQMVHEWESGEYKIIVMQKIASEERRIL